MIGPELAADLANLQDRLPPFPMSEARRMSAAFSDAGENGLHLDNATVDRMAAAQSARAWPARAALWLGACRWQQSQSSSGSLETACSALGR